MVYLTILVLNIILILILTKSKKSKFFFILFIFLALLGGGNYNNPDYFVYERIYNFSEVDRLEFGYLLLIKLGKLLQFNYQEFVFFIISLGLIAILYGVNNRGSNSYIFSLYFLYPFILDITQVRFFLSVSIFVGVFQFLNSNKKRDLLKYIIGIIVASSIHISALFYFVFLLVKLTYRKQKIMQFFIGVISLTFSLLILVNNHEIPYIMEILNYFDASIYAVYFNTTVDLGVLLPILYLVGSIILLSVSEKIVLKNQRINNNPNDLKFVRNVLSIHYFSIILIPLFLINLQFVRLYRSLSIVKYIVFAIANRNFPENAKKEKYTYNFLVVTFVLFHFVMELVLQDRLVRALIPIFKYNIFM